MSVSLGRLTGVFTSRPAFRVEGSAQPDLALALLSMLVEESTDGLCRCEVTFANWEQSDFRFFDRAVLDFGKALVIMAGAGDSEGEIFNGRISALEAAYAVSEPPTLTVLAEDRLMDLRMTRRTRFFEEMSDSDIIAQIASDHGLTPEIDLNDGSHPYIAQLNQSDLAFMRERAAANDCEIWVSDRTLHVSPRADRAGSEDFTLHLDEGLLAFTVSADLAHQRTAVVVTGWDVTAKQQVNARADDSALGNELGSDQSGASVLQSAFGERVDNLAHQQPITDAEAQALSGAAFRQMARRFVTGTGIAVGDARIRVGVQAQFDGLGAIFDGTYVFTEVRHLFDAQQGFRTEFRVERAGIGQ